MGGNVFKNCVPFDQSDSDKIVEVIDNCLSDLKIKAIVIGSSATPIAGKKSGDLDLMVEQNILGRHFNSHNPKQIRKSLKKFFDDKGFETNQSGVSVHVNVPLNGNYHQVDIMVVENALTVSKYHVHDIPENSPYKGLNKHLALMYLSKHQNLLWSAFSGLYRRDANGKRAGLVTQDIDEIAYILLGQHATADSLSSFEKIMSCLPASDARKMLEVLQQDPSWKEFK